jgi:murein DD-endopeptidase MepM/ murein hydrolase activator NlpD
VRVANDIRAYALYYRNDGGTGFGGGTAVLSLDYAIPVGNPVFGRADPIYKPGRFDNFDFTPDLGAEIGTKTWWRGLATCTALCLASWMLAPSFRPLPGTVPAAMPAAAFDETRAQSIAPLAWGGDTGRKMGATDAVQALTGTPERPTLDLSASLGQGDSLARALERAGVGSAEARQVANMTSDVIDPSAISPGTALALSLGRRASKNIARPLDSLAFRARFDMRVSFSRVNGALIMQRQAIAIDSTPLRISGPVGGGIFMAATAGGAPSDIAQDYIRALAPKVPMGNIDNDARFDMIVERDRAATGEVRFGKLLYVGLNQGNRATRMIQWTVGGRTDWYDVSGVGQTRPGFTMPVANARKTSGFGWRMHPLLGYSRMHQGTDYGAAYGTPIRAVTDGIVNFAGWHGGHGNMVKLSHNGGLGSGYAHMSRIAVSPGARVVQGQVIGYVGSTGLSTGAHLHFEVYRGGVAVSPGSVNFASQSLLSGGELAAFKAKFAAITGQ